MSQVVRRGTARGRARFAGASFIGVRIMLGWALTFLILAIVAGLLGFIALAGIAASPKFSSSSSLRCWLSAS
jgi:hypothetical protein